MKGLESSKRGMCSIGSPRRQNAPLLQRRGDPKRSICFFVYDSEKSAEFVEWLKRGIQTEDVELDYFYPGNAHILTVIELYTKDGDTYGKYRDDKYQADDAQGDTAGKYVKIYKKNDQYRFCSDRNIICKEYSNQRMKARARRSRSRWRRR